VTCTQSTTQAAVRPLRVAEIISTATASLSASGCDTPRLDAELLVADAMGVDRTDVVCDPNRILASDEIDRAWSGILRRAAREPVSYIRGICWFRHLKLRIDRRALIPRPETELLTEVALELGRGASVFEVGTGSGALALSIKDERPDLSVAGSDISSEAIALARENATALGLDVSLCHREGLAWHGADLVVANLPYVRCAQWPLLALDITRYEPYRALVAGPEGLEAIRALIRHTPPQTKIALEHAPGQAAFVRGMLTQAYTHRDLAGHERVTVGWVP
jgi:release factor glutamine methyltransferase